MPRKKSGWTLQVRVQPLEVARGHRVLPRAAVHATPRRPSRAQARRQWQHETRDQA